MYCAFERVREGGGAELVQRFIHTKLELLNRLVSDHLQTDENMLGQHGIASFHSHQILQLEASLKPVNYKSKLV